MERGSALSQAAASIAAAGYNPVQIPTLSIIASNWRVLEDTPRSSLVTAVSDWIQGSPGEASAILESMAPFDGTAKERRALVEAALAAESHLDPEERARVLIAARRIQGRDGRFVAARLVRGRLDAIRGSESPQDQQTWASLEPLLPEAGNESS